MNVLDSNCKNSTQNTRFLHYRQAFSFWASSWLCSKNPPATHETQETWVWSLGWKDPLEEEMATHSIVLAWKIPRTEKPCVSQSMGSQRVGHVRAGHACAHTRTHTHVRTHTHTHTLSLCLFSTTYLSLVGSLPNFPIPLIIFTCDNKY